MIKLAKLFKYIIFKRKENKLIIYVFYFPIFLGDYYVKLNAFYILSRFKYSVIIGKR